MYRLFKIFLSITVAFLVTFSVVPVSVKADIAPPEKPPGTNIVPGNEFTQVSMVSEIVVLNVLAHPASGSLGQAETSALFIMRNLGISVERMDVRFPLTFWNGISDGFFNYPDIKDLHVKVDGKSVPTRQMTMPNPHDGDDPPVPWSVFEVTFPPGKDVMIALTYTSEGFGEFPNVVFRYVLETGSGWKDTIGRADIVVHLPYEADEMNIFLDETTGYSQHTSPGFRMIGNELRWHFEYFEPTSEDNLGVTLVIPEQWQKVVAEGENVAENPADGEAWGRLGKAYKEIIGLRRGLRQDPGGVQMYRLSQDAYEKAVTYLPKDALWHYGYAELLWYHYYWGTYGADTSGLVHALRELSLSLDLDPDNSRALELADEIRYAEPEALQKTNDGFIFLALTATPLIVSPEYSVTPSPEPTVEPVQVAPSPIPGTQENGQTPALPRLPNCCTSSVLLPLLGVLIWLGTRRFQA
jgi:hypothetical protein